MPFALIIAGVILTVAGVRNTQATLFALLANDFTGDHPYSYWALSIVGLGSLGYIDAMRELVNWFLVLLLLVLFISNSQGQSIIAKFIAGLKAPIPAAPVAPASTASNVVGGVETGIGALFNPSGTAADIINRLSNIPNLPTLPALPSH